MFSISFPYSLFYKNFSIPYNMERIQELYGFILSSKRREEVLKTLKRKVFFVQQKLNHRLRIRPVPKIEFMEEGKTEQAGRVEELLKKVKDMEKN